MKKIYAFLLAGIMTLSLTACSETPKDGSSVYAPPLISTTTESSVISENNSSDNSIESEPQTVSGDTSTAENSSDTNSSVPESSQPEQSSVVTQSSSAIQSSSTVQSSSSPRSSSTSQSSSVTQSSSAPRSSSTSQSSSVTQSSSKPQSSSVIQSSSTSKASSISQPSLPPQQSVPEPKSPKVLVAYFSATNTTEGVAKRISEALNADLYEITPAVPYTSADLNYSNSSSRSSIEMNDPNSRPAISGSVNNFGSYDIVFLGYPIWWGEAPRILDTFVESYSFSGKTVVPFCTSGSSGVGSSARNLERLANGGQWLSGTRHSAGISNASIVSWINGLGLDVKA